MNQAISSTQTMSAKPDPSWMGVQPTALELYRLGLLRAASHHLPSIPPSNPWDCLAFRQISHRLIGWDRLYSERTGQEYIFQNYFDEAVIGPEVLCDVSSVLRPFVSDTSKYLLTSYFFQKLKQEDRLTHRFLPIYLYLLQIRLFLQVWPISSRWKAGSSHRFTV
jgi:hypothetical protein